jgi:hypothetical protein
LQISLLVVYRRDCLLAFLVQIGKLDVDLPDFELNREAVDGRGEFFRRFDTCRVEGVGDLLRCDYRLKGFMRFYLGSFEMKQPPY